MITAAASNDNNNDPTRSNNTTGIGKRDDDDDKDDKNVTTVVATPPYLQSSEPITHFGFESVQVKEKEIRVRQVFENVADSYDLMNDIMSGGLHRYWKDVLLDMSAIRSIAKAVKKQQLQQQQKQQKAQQQLKQNCSEDLTLKILDVAGGTGDVAFRFVEAAECLPRPQSSSSSSLPPPGVFIIDPIHVTVCDINPEMLRVGKVRARERYGHVAAAWLSDDNSPLTFVEGNAQSLEFPENTFDLYTIAFGLRNVTDVDKALSEAFRVLKPGGRFLCLEFSQVSDPILRQLYDTYSFHVIPQIGEWVANDRASYQYLVESIRKFSNQEELLQRMNAVGFQLTKYTNLTGGIVAIHEGWKPF